MKISSGDWTEDVIIEILSNLPVKSLLRLRCACKSWYALIKNPTFIYKHLNINNNAYLFVQYYDEGNYVEKFSFFSDETLTDLSLQEFIGSPNKMVSGPHNGIFCLIGDNIPTALWNPATREHRNLPECILPPGIVNGKLSVGCGMNPITNDYKLVLIYTVMELGLHESHVAVYNFGTNSWKDFKGPEMEYDCLAHTYDTTYLNGICYWLAKQNHEFKIILAFDMGHEKFEEIQVPSNSALRPKILGLYDDCLCLLLWNTTENCFEIWLMKERSWMKHLRIGPLVGVGKPLVFWKKGAFIVPNYSDGHGHLVLYDPSKKEIRDIFTMVGIRFCCLVGSYKESLISIKAVDNF